MLLLFLFWREPFKKRSSSVRQRMWHTCDHRKIFSHTCPPETTYDTNFHTDKQSNMSEKSNHTKTPAKQHNSQPAQSSKMINKLLIIQWCFVFETKHHWMIKSLLWYVLCGCVVDCCVISFLTFAHDRKKMRWSSKLNFIYVSKVSFNFSTLFLLKQYN